MSDKHRCIIFDEAFRGFSSRAALSEINKLLIQLVMEMRQKNLCVFIVLPTFFMLEKYIALSRSAGLFHIYMNKLQRGYYVLFNKKNKQRLYLKGRRDMNMNAIKYPNFRGRFMNKYPIDEKKYRSKKLKMFKQQVKEKAEDKKGKFRKQRDLILLSVYEKFGLTSQELSAIIKTKGVDMPPNTIRKVFSGLKNHGFTK